MFRFYTNAVSQASRSFAIGTFMSGLLLVGFGVLILALPEVFAFLAAMIFFVAGAGCAATALKIYLVFRHLDKTNRDDNSDYRKNVRIHLEEHQEF